MRTSAAVPAIAITAVVAFLLGRSSTHPSAGTETAQQQNAARPVSSSPGSASLRPPSGKSSSPAKVSTLDRLSVERARQMSPKERLELLSKGAMVFDGVKQADLLCSVISSLSKDEIAEATRILGDVQDRGNFHAQVVWDALWTQWGRVDPEGVLKIFTDAPNGKSRSDSRHLMAGWWETDPEGALAWAKEPKTAPHDIEAAAMALSNSAGNDPKKLEQIIQTLPSGDPRIRECLQDYLDLTNMAQGEDSAAGTYDNLPPELKAAAWPLVLQRLTIGDPDSAMDWIGQHASDPGFDPLMSYQLVQRVSAKDPAAAMKLTTALPASEYTDVSRNVVLNRWVNTDPGAVRQWLDTQPQDSPLVNQFSQVLEIKKAHFQQNDLIWEDADQ